MQNNLEIVSMIKVNGEWVSQDEVSQKNCIIEKTLDRAMGNIGYQRIKTAKEREVRQIKKSLQAQTLFNN